jgi:hypothetical protein
MSNNILCTVLGYSSTVKANQKVGIVVILGLVTLATYKGICFLDPDYI